MGVSEPNWETLFASIRKRYLDLQGGDASRLQSFLSHVENLGVWEADGSFDTIIEARATFPETLFVAFATCHVDCGAAEFIVEGSTQECQRCGRLPFRHTSKEYAIKNSEGPDIAQEALQPCETHSGSSVLKIGDRVRIDRIPHNLPPDGDADGLNTSALFQRCLGRVFPIVAFNEMGFAELQVGEAIGRKPYLETIWIEPECLVVMEGPD